MREAVVKQAVTFLSNPSVKSQSWANKRQFLEGKGLTEEEINTARERHEQQEANPVTASTSTMGATAAAHAGPVAAPQSGSSLPWLQKANMGPQTSAVPSPTASTPTKASHTQALLLLQRRLAELEYERASVLSAIEALGGPLAAAPTTTSLLMPSRPSSEEPRVPSIFGESEPVPQASSNTNNLGPMPPAVNGVSTGQAPKPWERPLPQAPGQHPPWGQEGFSGPTISPSGTALPPELELMEIDLPSKQDKP